jgi:hypothetical protein
MALKSCYECNKEISTKSIICPQCGAPQNPVSGLIDKEKVSDLIDKAINKSREGGRFLQNYFKNLKEMGTKAIDRQNEKMEMKRKIKDGLEESYGDMDYEHFKESISGFGGISNATNIENYLLPNDNVTNIKNDLLRNHIALMVEIEIENTFYWEVEVRKKLNEMLARKKEESIP